jgi:hypothetical protein
MWGIYIYKKDGQTGNLKTAKRLILAEEEYSINISQNSMACSTNGKEEECI